IATLGGPRELAMVFDSLTGSGAARPDLQAMLLSALEQAAQRRGARPEGELYGIEKMLSSQHEAVRAAAARVVGLWHMESLRPALAKLACAPESSPSLRQAAIDGLKTLGGQSSVKELEQLADPPYPLPV